VAPVTEVSHAASAPLIATAHEATLVATGRSKILIVDDEPLNVDYLEQELEDRGYETISAANGQEALEKVAAEAPDLILLDVMMPMLDGFTVCRILKDHEETRLIPIIIMTALDAVADRIQGIKAGADDFLTKPVYEEELFARIETALKLKHTVDRKIGELRALKDHFAKLVRLVTMPDAPSS
jgi:DNA-binding response OmpR family regulator